MPNRIFQFLFLGIVLAMPTLGFAADDAAPAKVRGRIIAARVEGPVDAIQKADGTSRVLHDGDELTDQTEVVTHEGASIILVFSNGASVNLAADSILDIEQFLQDPFAAPLKFSDMKTEPGTSVTHLSISKGEFVGKVVHLNVAKGSEFTINTPAGAAGIRGTIFRVIFRPNPKTGKVYFSVTTTQGLVVFKGVSATPIDIPAGKQVVATFEYTAPTVANPAGSVESTGVKIVTNTVSPTEAAQVQTSATAIQTAVINTIVTSPSAAAPVISTHDAADTGNAQTGAAAKAATLAPLVQPTNPAVVSPSS